MASRDGGVVGEQLQRHGREQRLQGVGDATHQLGQRRSFGGGLRDRVTQHGQRVVADGRVDVFDVDEVARERVGLAAARRAARGSVPVLTRERRLPPGRRVGTTIRHLGGAIALWRLRDKRKGGDGSTEGLSRRLRVAAEHLGPTYIKLAQIISAGEGLFPDPLVEQMKLCRDRVRPEPFETVKQVIEEDFGKRLDELFLVFDPQSLAAASIAAPSFAQDVTGSGATLFESFFLAPANTSDVIDADNDGVVTVLIEYDSLEFLSFKSASKFSSSTSSVAGGKACNDQSGFIAFRISSSGSTKACLSKAL